MDKAEFFGMKIKLDYDKAKRKTPYWKVAGESILPQNMSEKWCNFVEEHVNGFGHGLLIDETLLIMTMLSAGIDTKQIGKLLDTIGNKGTVIEYLGNFVNPDVIKKINQEQNPKQNQEYDI